MKQQIDFKFFDLPVYQKPVYTGATIKTNQCDIKFDLITGNTKLNLQIMTKISFQTIGLK